MNFILTSCGLSLLINYLKKFNIFLSEVYKYSTCNESEIGDEFKLKVNKALKNLRNLLEWGFGLVGIANGKVFSSELLNDIIFNDDNKKKKAINLLKEYEWQKF